LIHSNRLFLFLLLPLFWLGGCASPPRAIESTAVQVTDPGPGAEAECTDAAVELLGRGTRAPDLAAMGQLCLQTGRFQSAETLLAELIRTHPQHADADYHAYLHVLARFGGWSAITRFDYEEAVRLGRDIFLQIVAYLRERPLSPYGDGLAPRLVALREGIAEAELGLARQALRDGYVDQARARAEYVLESYPRTQAAVDAARWLQGL